MLTEEDKQWINEQLKYVETRIQQLYLILSLETRIKKLEEQEKEKR